MKAVTSICSTRSESVHNNVNSNNFFLEAYFEGNEETTKTTNRFVNMFYGGSISWQTSKTVL